DKSTSTSLPGVSFVGDFLFSTDQLLHPSPDAWRMLFSYSPLGVILPGLILCVSAVLAGRYFMGEPGRAPLSLERRRLITILFLLYWLPILAVGAIATEQNERYLIHIHPIGLALIVLLIYELVVQPTPHL